MKLVYLMRYWPVFGGGETVTRTLANEMSRRGHDVYVIYLWYRTNNLEVKLNPKIRSIKIENISNIHDGGLKKSEYAVLQRRLMEKLEDINPDIIINQWLPTKIVAHAIKKLPAKIIKCHHGVIKYVPTIKTLKQKFFYGIFGDKAGWIRVYHELKDDYIYSNVWVLLSQASFRDAKYLFPWADDKRLAVIPNPLSYDIGDNHFDMNLKKKEVIFVGRVIKLKRVSYLLDAWKIIEDNVPDWCFRIIGDGDNLEHDKKYAEEIGVKHVIFEGYKDAKDYMKNASILLVASNQEGFGMVIIEAQYFGCVPIVVASYPTIYDLVDNGVNGYLVENNNVKKYAETLYSLIQDDEKRNKMAQDAIANSKKFMVSNICNLWENLFKSLDTRREEFYG